MPLSISGRDVSQSGGNSSAVEIQVPEGSYSSIDGFVDGRPFSFEGVLSHGEVVIAKADPPSRWIKVARVSRSRANDVEKDWFSQRLSVSSDSGATFDGVTVRTDSLAGDFPRQSDFDRWGMSKRRARRSEVLVLVPVGASTLRLANELGEPTDYELSGSEEEVTIVVR